MSKNIKCYLCGSEASEEEEKDSSRNLLVKCNKLCKPYSLSSGVQMFFIDRNKINEDDKKKLIDFVNREFERTKNSVKITVYTMEREIGKK